MKFQAIFLHNTHDTCIRDKGVSSFLKLPHGRIYIDPGQLFGNSIVSIGLAGLDHHEFHIFSSLYRSPQAGQLAARSIFAISISLSHILNNANPSE